MKRVLLRSAVICSVLWLSACSSVQPWERGNLARADMAWDPDPMGAALNEHIHAAKEASTGGASTGGGGCGCN